MARTPVYRWVNDPTSLSKLASKLLEAPRHTLDLESNSGFAYRERVCLIQFRVQQELWVVDPLVLPGDRDALEALREPLESPDRTTLLHGGEFDVGCLKRDFGIHLRGVWDSQQAASFLGLERTGYGALIERFFEVKLDKKYTLYDWGKRPIAQGPLGYALDDVVYLPDLCDALRALVEKADLVEEVELACRAVESAVWSGGSGSSGIWRIKGAGQLEDWRQALLTALLGWREQVAKELDRPPGRVINNRALIALARNPPARVDDLRRLGLARGAMRSRGEDLLEVVREARRNPPTVPARALKQRGDKEAKKREERLKAFRRAESARRGVPEQAVLPAAALQYLARRGVADLEAVPQKSAARRPPTRSAATTVPVLEELTPIH